MPDVIIGIGTKDLTHDQLTDSGLELLNSSSLATLAQSQIVKLFGDPDIFDLVQRDQIQESFSIFELDMLEEHGCDPREVTYFTSAFEDATACVLALFSIFRTIQGG